MSKKSVEVPEESDWLKEKFEVHGLVGLVNVKGFAPNYADLIAMLEKSGIEHDIDAVHDRGLGRHIQEIFSMACEGALAREIADKVGANIKTVNRFCSRHGIRIERELTLADLKADVVEMAVSGKTAEYIAEFTGKSVGAVSRFAKANGIIIADQYHPGYITTHNGYIMVHRPGHPFADGKGYVRLHRLVMEEKIGRYLTANETVHHKDGDKKNNAIGNLELLTKSLHASMHARNGETGWAKYHEKRRNKI